MESPVSVMNSYVSDFNEHFQKFRLTKNASFNSSLNCTLSLMCEEQNLDSFNPNSLGNTQFYIYLHQMMSIDEIDPDLLWACVSVVQHSSRNLETRNALVGRFRFFPLLANLLTKISTQEKSIKLLEIIQDLSYGIQITWEEPYLSDLIKHLLQYINSDEEIFAQLAVSILINLCYRNFAVICLLMRTINVSTLCRKIKKYGILANKLTIILEKDDSKIDLVDLECLIKKTFSDIELTLQNWNVPHLKHTVDFFDDVMKHSHIGNPLSTYQNFEEEFKEFIKKIESRLSKNDFSTSNGNEQYKNVQNCIGLIFELINLMLNLNFELKVENASRISSEMHLHIIEISIKWIDSDYTGVKVVNLMKTVVECVNDDLLMKVLEIFNILQRLVSATENNEVSSEFSAAFQKLLIVMLKRKNSEHILFPLLTDSYFNKIFMPLLSSKSETFNFSLTSTFDLSKYLHCFYILIEFSRIAESTWKSKVIQFFQFEQMQFILAQGLFSENQELSELVFEISKSEYFPKNLVAKFMRQVKKIIQTNSCAHNSLESLPNFDSFVENNRLIVSKAFEDKLDAILKKFFNSKSEIENIATSELIELYTYKSNIMESKLYNLNKSLEDSSKKVTELSHEISLHTAELSKYTSINFRMNLSQEKLTNENKDLKTQKDIFKKTADDLGKKIKENSESLKRHSKIHEVKLAEKMSEIKDIRKELAKLESQRDEYANKIKKLTSQLEENTSKIETLKKSLQLVEGRCEEFTKQIQQKEEEIIRQNKIIDDMKKNQSVQENVIKNLENQIKEKNNSIKTLEAELNETEDMRKTIMSLMESKKPKRKQ